MCHLHLWKCKPIYVQKSPTLYINITKVVGVPNSYILVIRAVYNVTKNTKYDENQTQNHQG